jgi:hypothetical protein
MRGRDAENDAPEKPPGAEDGGQGHTTNTTTAWSRTPSLISTPPCNECHNFVLF